jgi:hypothetical protein
MLAVQPGTKKALDQLPSLTLKMLARELSIDATEVERRIGAAASTLLRKRPAPAMSAR